jgi:hypothetical protein
VKNLLELLQSLSSNLHAAIWSKNIKEIIAVVEKFHQRKLSIDNAVMAGVTPLFRAIQSKNIDIVKVIINAGASVHSTLPDGRSALDYAKESPDIYNLLTQHQSQNIDSSFLEEQILFIPPDGNCMYNSVLEGYRRLGRDDTPDLSTLREMVYDRIINSTGGEHNEYTHAIEQQLINLIANFPITIENLEDLAGLNLEIYNIIKPYILLYNSGTPVLDSMRQNGAVNQYIETILTSGNWGRDVELSVMSRVLDIEIIIHGPGAPIIVNNAENEHAPSIHLSFTGNHYNLIIHHAMNTHLFNIEEEDEDISYIFPDEEQFISDQILPNDLPVEMLFVATILMVGISLYDNEFFQWYN